jgi:threonine dehydrogenase-like Zn-dependent dehydrogenase
MKSRASILRAPHAKFETVELDVDDPQPTEVLVKMVASGLCQSDDHVATGDISVPVFPSAAVTRGRGSSWRSGQRYAVFPRAITWFSRSWPSAVAAGSVPAGTRICATTEQTSW